MRRLRTMTAMVYAMMAASCAAGCNSLPGKVEAKSPPEPIAAATAPVAPKGPIRQPGKAAAPNRMKPVIFDPFATPFAVVETDRGTCALSANADNWRIEPPLPSNAAAKNTGKTGGTADSKAARYAAGTVDGQVGVGGHSGGPSGGQPGKPAGTPDQQPTAQAAIEIDNTGETPRRLGPGTKPYCVYRWKKPGLPTRQDFKAIGAIPDKPIIGGTPSAAKGEVPKLPPTVWQPLEKIFAHQAHGIDPKRWRELVRRHSPPGGAVPVRVAVVDATPVGLKGLDPSLHGTVVSYVVGTLLCDDPRKPECAERVRPYLALPMTTVTEGDPKGGYWGSFFHLADALGNALADWRPQSERLVINLSLGWDPLKLDRNDPHQQRVLALLRQASCLGAITVAAAGNPTGSDGAIYPGRFEEFPAPDRKECAKLGIAVPEFRWPATASKKPVFAPDEVYQPLVHSVGAVDNRDQRLASDRRWGQPRLAALGLSVTVPGRANMPYLPPFTGTSMSTAIVSGVAAAVWSMRPELTATEVMALVYRGGVALDGLENSNRAETEYCVGEHYGCKQRPKVHRVYLCGAIAQALQDKVPAEKLACNDTVSTAFPKWPKAQTTVVAQGPCRIANCGLPTGPVSDQMAGADVAPHGGFAECPGCTVSIVTGVPVLSGIAIPPDDMAGLEPELLVRITGRYNSKEFVIFDVPFGDPMDITGMEIPERPQGAVLTFSYWSGISVIRTDAAFPIPLDK